MSGSNSTPTNGDWVRLNVGGKVFQTTKDTLSRFPESFLACLVSGVLPSDKDEAGAFLIDRDPKHFRIILNYLRNGELLMDGNEIAMKELLREADFYGLKALVEEVSKHVRPTRNRIEAVTLCAEAMPNTYSPYSGTIFISESQDDYEILKALRDKTRLSFIFAKKGQYKFHHLTGQNLLGIEMTLCGFGFAKESYGDKRNICWKFVSKANIVRSESIALCVKKEHLNVFPNRTTTSAVLFFSESRDDYEILKALRDGTRHNFEFINKGQYSIHSCTYEEQMGIEAVLRDLGFVQEPYDGIHFGYDRVTQQCWKFARSVSI